MSLLLILASIPNLVFKSLQLFHQQLSQTMSTKLKDKYQNVIHIIKILGSGYCRQMIKEMAVNVPEYLHYIVVIYCACCVKLYNLKNIFTFLMVTSECQICSCNVSFENMCCIKLFKVSSCTFIVLPSTSSLVRNLSSGVCLFRSELRPIN